MLKGTIVAGAMAVAALSVGVAAAPAQERSEQTVIKPRDFTIPKGQCPNLPAGLEIKGVGIERSVTVVDSQREGEAHENGEDGGLTYRLVTKIDGTATDNAGGTYTFAYQLQVGRKPIPLPGSGIAVDTFKLTGTGAANGLSTLIRVRVTLDAASNPVAFDLIETAGDPFHCDPL